MTVRHYSLGPGRTCWVLVADTTEPRHLCDLGLAYWVLRGRGYSADDLIVFTSHPSPGGHLGLFGAQDWCPLTDLPLLHCAGRYETCVVVVSGHGHEHGFGTPPIYPSHLVSAVRGIRGLQAGVLIFGQCYAGVFNPMDASSRPHLVAIGATNLDTSLSTTRSMQLQGQPVTWAANAFLVGIFEWIHAPRDIDGDGDLTLADAYKAAGVFAGKLTNQAKASAFLRAQTLAAKMAEPLNALERAAVARQLSNQLELLHQMQVPWLLHARLASCIRF